MLPQLKVWLLGDIFSKFLNTGGKNRRAPLEDSELHCSLADKALVLNKQTSRVADHRPSFHIGVDTTVCAVEKG